MDDRTHTARAWEPGPWRTTAARRRASCCSSSAWSCSSERASVRFTPLRFDEPIRRRPGRILTVAAGGFCVVLGLVAASVGWLSAQATYVAGETIPVLKDSATYLSDGRGIAGDRPHPRPEAAAARSHGSLLPPVRHAQRLRGAVLRRLRAVACRTPRIERVAITHPDAQLLVEAVQEEYVARYGSRDDSPIDPRDFEDPLGRFFVGRLGGEPVATGAWRRSSVQALGADRHRRGEADVRRPRRAASRHRPADARPPRGHRRGGRHRGDGPRDRDKQPEAIELYLSSGYEPVPGFGYHRDSELSRCFARRI